MDRVIVDLFAHVGKWNHLLNEVIFSNALWVPFCTLYKKIIKKTCTSQKKSVSLRSESIFKRTWFNPTDHIQPWYMDDNFAIQLFEGKRVRIVWDADQEKYYFSVVDIVQVLTDSADYQTARKYWKVLKGRLKKEGNESVTNCYQLKLPSSDGTRRRRGGA